MKLFEGRVSVTYEDLLVEADGGIQVVRLNRPEVLNAIREKTFLELEAVLDAANDEKVGVLIITGSGDRAFDAGGDVKSLEKMTSGDAISFARLAHRVLGKIEGLPKPIIAAVNGLALGAGCDLAVACDLCVASRKAAFGEPPTGLGITTPFGGTQRLPRIVGPKRAKHMFFTGDTIDADTALQIGLVNMVVEHERLMYEAKNLAKRILARAPIAVGYCKALVNKSIGGNIEEGDEMEMELYARCFDTEDKREGTRAFLEKRKPLFRGR